ncbi:glycoside hydrolase family protein [Paraburkholderia kururiensis]|uniref:glycoside hydrolase family protein n=1 Tax=Paraburkholderia kururiensis TaxID=984307 RepID=UPI0005AB2C8A|nr:hypothetical protein [Paraburkholderia kururiensis]
MNLDLMDKELRRDEGVRYVKYLDTKGIPTTGVGHNLLASPLPAGWKFPLNDAQVDQLLDHDLTVTFAGLDLHLPWWRKLDEVRQRVIANMAFNLGVDKLLGFKNTLAAVQRGAYAIAAAGMKASAWYKQVGDRSVRLCKAMESGVMPTA